MYIKEDKILNIKNLKKIIKEKNFIQMEKDIPLDQQFHMNLNFKQN